MINTRQTTFACVLFLPPPRGRVTLAFQRWPISLQSKEPSFILTVTGARPNEYDAPPLDRFLASCVSHLACCLFTFRMPHVYCYGVIAEQSHPASPGRQVYYQLASCQSRHPGLPDNSMNKGKIT